MSIETGLADLRRLYRSGRPATVVLVSLARLVAIPRHPAFFHYLRNSLEELAVKLEGAFHPLPGDSYLLWTYRPAEELVPLLAVILDIEAEEPEAAEGASWQGSVETFVLPGEYERLRLALQHLADRAPVPTARPPRLRERPAALAPPAAGRLTEERPPRGPLTAAALDRAERLLDGAELGRFLRRQRVCRLGARLETDYVEISTSITELGRSFFPDLALTPEGPLFPALLAHLDRLLLIELLLSRPFTRQTVGINLSLASLETPEFSRFDRALAAFRRDRIVIELHWLDWLRDLEAGSGRIAALQRSGYRLAVDRLVPGPGLAALRPEMFEADFYKLVWSAENAAAMAASGFTRVLEGLPRERLILTNCDHRQALEMGASLGIRRYQGWLVDRLVREATIRPALSLTGSEARPAPGARSRNGRRSRRVCCS